MMQTFGEKLRALRLEHDLTQQQVADALGSTQARVSYVERRESAPKESTVREYADMFGVPITYFYEDQSNVLSQKDYQALIGILALGERYNEKLHDLLRLAQEITGEEDEWGHCADALFSEHSSADELIDKLGLQVADK